MNSRCSISSNGAHRARCRIHRMHRRTPVGERPPHPYQSHWRHTTHVVMHHISSVLDACQRRDCTTCTRWAAHQIRMVLKCPCSAVCRTETERERERERERRERERGDDDKDVVAPLEECVKRILHGWRYVVFGKAGHTFGRTLHQAPVGFCRQPSIEQIHRDH